MSKVMLRDYIVNNVSYDSVKALLNFADKKGLHIECYEGSLLDNYVIYTDKQITINRAKARRFIIIEEYYTNCWSSGLKLIMTDDVNKVNDFINILDDDEC